ncbi:PAS domain-containing protein [Labrys miyagiensis]|uniref:PAS domain-containing protein n=1 Tax=Labrys miyagiensis TaxID=346912 RepID=A0ABQ6CTR4_9HYPH|nr:PAS domain-containing protein [Labrys miyagiensis]GLS23771.1 PAS domain-containing protein [Labrys miyagiensis]
MKNAATRDLYGYWDNLRAGRPAPERVDIDPAAIRRVLGDTFIVEIDKNHTLPFRLAGTRMCALLGQELRGASLLDRWAERAVLEDVVMAVSADMTARVISVKAGTLQGHELDLELLLLPLHHRGKANARILGCLTPNEAPYWIGLHPIARFDIAGIEKVLYGQTLPTKSARSTALPAGARRYGHLTLVDGGKAHA